ncbi:hypothetical protein EP331_07450 [bacterium]|nr:MAG: hypothetical protein EP331_07450 [bacterium]
MEEVLQNLANLQYIDSRIDEIARLRGDLPEEIADIEMDIARLQNRVKNLEQESLDLKKEGNMLNGDVEEAKLLVDKYEKQQMTVRNNREYDALTKEIESQKQRIENALSRLDEINILLDENERNTFDSKDALAETEDVLANKQTDLERLKSQTKAEETELLKKRESAAKQVGDRYIRNYERLRGGFKNGLVVVPMERGACLGMMLPPQVQVEVRKKNRIIIDESSGRIVIDQSFFDVAEREFKASLG